MFDWHKAYESQDLKDIVYLFLDSTLRQEAGLKIVEMLLLKPDARRGKILDDLGGENGYSKATLERTLHDLETIGLISSEGKYLKTGRYRVNFTRFSGSLSRLSRTIKKVETESGDKQKKISDSINETDVSKGEYPVKSY